MYKKAGLFDNVASDAFIKKTCNAFGISSIMQREVLWTFSQSPKISFTILARYPFRRLGLLQMHPNFEDVTLH